MVFSRPGCPHCARAKSLLESNGYPYDEIALGGHITTLVSGFDSEFAFGSTSATSLRQLVIETTAVPEPASGALVSLGLLAIAARRRNGGLRPLG